MEVILHNKYKDMSYKIRLVEIEDTSFIIKLRSNPKLNKHLNKTSPSVENQINWIKEYKKREDKKEEFYFIVLENGIKRGLYRLYNVNKYSFTIGSWLFDNCIYKQLPIISDLLISEYGFKILGLPIMLFDIRKQNRKVINYHSLKEPLCYNENDENLYYLIKSEDWTNSKKNIMSFFGIEQAFLDDIQIITD